MSLLPYHLRLALRSLRRDPGLSVTIVAVLAIAGGIFCTALLHYLRTYVEGPALSPTLHQVEIPAPLESLRVAFEGSNAEPNIVAARARVSYPVYRDLVSSGLEVKQTGTFRSRVILRLPSDPEGRAPRKPRNVRFVSADFFDMFGLPLEPGGVWSRADEKNGRRVVVVSYALSQQLWDGDSPVGKTLLIDGDAYTVVGAMEDEPPFKPEWDRVGTGGAQDQIYLPFGEHVRLRARPEVPVVVAPLGPKYEDLLSSDAVFISFWIDLPTAELKAAYERHLKATLGARGLPYVLRDFAAVNAALAMPRTVITFFVGLTFIVLLVGGLVVMRLLLAKGVARRGEHSILRALGAPRRALMQQQLIEAGLLAAVGAVLAMPIVGAQAYYFNQYVGDTDIPLVITPLAFGITFVLTVGVTLAFAAYPGWRSASRRPTAALVRS
jgi:putative ABC transport system permease protein